MLNIIETRSITSVSQIKEQAKTVLWLSPNHDSRRIWYVQNRISKAWLISQMWCPGRNYPNWERRGPQQLPKLGEKGSWTIQQVFLLSYMFNPNLLYGAVYIHVYIYIYIYMYIYIFIYNITLFIYTYIFAFACVCMFIGVYVCVSICFTVFFSMHTIHIYIYITKLIVIYL